MNDIKIFENEQFGKIRTAGTADSPLFCLADVCKAVELANPSSVKKRLDEDDTQLLDLHALNYTEGGNIGNTMATFITESGFYDVILYSNSKRVRSFRKWVTSEVLPTIRKTGSYGVPQTFAQALRLAAEQQEQIEAQQKQLEEQKPKVNFANAMLTSTTSCLVGELAKVITQNGYTIGQNRLFQWLRENGYLGKWGERKNIPLQQYVEQGLFQLKKSTWTDNNDVTHTTTTVKVTGKGQEYFINKFLNNNK